MRTQPQYAGFWTRFTAYVLDSLILGIPFVLIVMPIIYSVFFDVDELTKQLESQDVRGFFVLYSTIIKAAVISLIAWAAMLALITNTRWQASVGKRIMGIYVTDADGNKPKFLPLFLRYLALPILILTIQTPERFYIYENLELLAQKSNPTQADLEQSMLTPISGFISLLSLGVLLIWYGLISLRPQKTAGHDILFNTRVIHGRP